MEPPTIHSDVPGRSFWAVRLFGLWNSLISFILFIPPHSGGISGLSWNSGFHGGSPAAWVACLGVLVYRSFYHWEEECDTAVFYCTICSTVTTSPTGDTVRPLPFLPPCHSFSTDYHHRSFIFHSGTSTTWKDPPCHWYVFYIQTTCLYRYHFRFVVLVTFSTDRYRSTTVLPAVTVTDTHLMHFCTCLLPLITQITCHHAILFDAN